MACSRDVPRSKVVVLTGDQTSGFRDKHEQEFDVAAIIAHEDYSGIKMFIST